MKASELITLLQDAIDTYGDLPLTTFDMSSNIDFNFYEVMPLDEGGYEINSSMYDGKPITILVDPIKNLD